MVADEAQLKQQEHVTKRGQHKQLRRSILEADWEGAANLLGKSCARLSQWHCL